MGVRETTKNAKIAKVRLGDVAVQIRGVSYKPKDAREDAADGYTPLLRANNIANGVINHDELVYVRDECIRENQLLVHGDILICASSGSKALVGKAALVRSGSVDTFGAFCKAIRPNIGRVGCEYLAHYFQSDVYRNTISNAAAGANINNIRSSDLDELQIPLPSLPEQKRIAEELDQICELKKNAEERLALMDQLVKSRFVEMFGNVVGNDRGWTISKFGEVTDSRLGKMLDAKKQTGLHKRNYLANFNVQWFKIDASELHEMDFDEADRLEFALKDGDLLVCEGGESGRCCVWRNQIENCYYQKALHRVRCHADKLDPDFLSYWFLMSCKGHAFDHILGAKATIAHLPGVKLKALDVVVPPLALQREFAAFVAEIDKSKLVLHETVAKMETLYRAKLQEYFG